MTTIRSAPPDIDGLTFNHPVGGGGFADVFLYVQHSTKRLVAVKVLRAEHLQQSNLAQFEAEADIMARVSAHPYIVTVLDAGVAADGRPYIVMEYYPRPHFGQRARGGRLRVPEVLRVGIQVASAVETAHRSGILHRDIKPANILTSDYDDPGLTDFGLASVQDGAGITATGGVSQGFAAPEILLDEQATGSRASDVYGLGATLYAMLAGRSPIWHPGGDNSQGALVHRAATGQIPPTGRDDVPPMLEHVLRMCLDPDPSRRPDGAASLARLLQDVEQALTLPLTRLALVAPGDGQATRPDRLDEDRTTRRARVVDLGYGGGAPPSPNVHPTPPDDLQPAPPSVEAESAMSDAPRTPRWSMWLVVAAAAIVALAVALVALRGTEPSDTNTATTTTLLRPSSDDPVLPSTPSAPLDPTAVRNADGTVTISWQPPDGAGEGSDYEYEVSDAEGVSLERHLSATRLQVPASANGAEQCFEITATLDGTTSQSSARACTQDGSD
ncbi:MAG: protein kinase [Actinobacteria bacterium]|nr:protein kinase [Actinomycetota bacterium]